ncbi:hypothetical protein BH11PSE9_BH11PSE9_31190 [soil metagenome]
MGSYLKHNLCMHLTRNEPAKCVMARISRLKQVTQQNFGLKEYGTWRKAEKAAREWVKVKLLELPDPVTMKDRKTSRNTSGVVGVRLANATRKRNGKEYPDWRWVAIWPGCPKSGGVGWSVNKYGDERAFMSAYVARKLESGDREQVEAEYQRIKGTAKYRKVLAMKSISPPALSAPKSPAKR